MSRIIYNNKLPFVLLGSGGHAKVLYEILQLKQLPVSAYIALATTPDSYFSKLDYLGNDSQHTLKKDQAYLVNTLGSIKSTEVREHIYQTYSDQHFIFPNIIHPKAIISNSVKLGKGTQHLCASIVNVDSIIGDNTIINTAAIVEHDCNIGAHNHIAPRAVVCGHVNTGDNVHIGAGAIINQGLHIGHHVTIASGSVVINDIPDNTLVMGVPAKKRT